MTRCWRMPWRVRPPPKPKAPARIAPARAVSNRWPAPTPRRVLSRPGAARPVGLSRKVTATAAGGLFFPQSKGLGIDQSETSAALQQKLTYAGTVSRSFAEGSELLERLADVSVSAKQVERVTRRVGAERVAERDAEVAAYQGLPLVEKFAVPGGVTPPEVAVVMADGGRLQILDRTAAATDPPPAAEGVADPVAAAAETWDEERERSGHWREDKVGLLLTMHSAMSTIDPCPDIPPSFLDATRIPELVHELARHVKEPTATDAAPASAETAAAAVPERAAYQPPQVVQRKVLASRRTWPLFAPIVAAAAWAWGFQGATRKAFVGDGSANHWRLQRRFFASFVPILDFIHALSYVYAAATAARARVPGWVCYRQWITWVWQGQVARVLTALEERQVELGQPEKDEPETSPRQVVARALTYLGNQQDKMRYDEYRRQGLPITSSLMESVVKQVNRRVKGTEKFWSEDGAEALLQLRADQLRDDQPLDAFWQRRQEAATGQRRYRPAA
ncbi:MAG: hypothetical protein LC674_00690 [Actinobacteria bacterium]|nr:hypothetical protein [Actinomycetota bacterium]